MGGARDVGVDVTVRHPLAPSNVALSARSPKALLEDAEREKRNTYDRLASRDRVDFKAMAFTTYGGFGDEALQVIKLVIDQGKKMGLVWQPRDVVYRVSRSVAVAIARGNMEVVRANLGCQTRPI